MKVLFVSRYVDPYPVGGNKNVYLQAQSLKRDFGVDVEILTCPKNDLWTGPVPKSKRLSQPQVVELEGLVYHVFKAPDVFDTPAGGAVLSQCDWERAVRYGMQMLSSLKPTIVHLQHRHGLWWILESAQRLGMATVYSNHDWGIPCMRTVLVMGDKTLCDGVVAPQKCAQCIKTGRKTLAGRMNEALVSNHFGELVAKTAIKAPLLGSVLRKKGLVTEKTVTRTTIHYERAARAISGLCHCFTPSRFGASFFSRIGCSPERISVMPWYYDPVDTNKNIEVNQMFTITYIGRVSPEKGVDFIFSALEKLTVCEPILLRIAGANDSRYCTQLRSKYPASVGIHSVQWLGWSQVEPLFQNTDATIIPSQWIDNTPLSLIEAMAYRTPVIATRVPPIEELLVEDETGFLSDYRSVDSLAAAIHRAVKNKAKIRRGGIKFPSIPGIKEYIAEVVRVYKCITTQSEN